MVDAPLQSQDVTATHTDMLKPDLTLVIWLSFHVLTKAHRHLLRGSETRS